MFDKIYTQLMFVLSGMMKVLRESHRASYDSILQFVLFC